MAVDQLTLLKQLYHAVMKSNELIETVLNELIGTVLSLSYESKIVNLHLESGRGVDFHLCVRLVEDLESAIWQSSLE